MLSKRTFSTLQQTEQLNLVVMMNEQMLQLHRDNGYRDGRLLGTPYTAILYLASTAPEFATRTQDLERLHYYSIGS